MLYACSKIRSLYSPEVDVFVFFFSSFLLRNSQVWRVCACIGEAMCDEPTAVCMRLCMYGETVWMCSCTIFLHLYMPHIKDVCNVCVCVYRFGFVSCLRVNLRYCHSKQRDEIGICVVACKNSMRECLCVCVHQVFPYLTNYRESVEVCMVFQAHTNTHTA